ncbi:MAG: nucleotide-binding domain containing protein, partial [Humibacter sp.]
DLRSAVLSVLDAESSGIRIVYRVGPSFVRARLGQGSQPPLDDFELAALLRSARDAGAVARHGLVAVGSHVGLSNRQLAALTASRDVHAIELDVERVLDDDAQAHIAQVASLAAASLDDRVTVISTSRGLVRGVDAATSLDLSRRVSAALTETVRRVVLARRPAYVIAKGGITSSDIATDALGISRARVVGSMLPGIVSVWQAASGPATGLPYVVFAGNVGDDTSLATVVARWESARESADRRLG